jgi:sterol desaturase/sphingolipid hydroxylase (fatty acid hydroxylase superfamily)
MQLFKNTYTFWTILIIANIAMYGLTILISYSWSKIKQHKTLQLTKQDIYNSILVLVINILVAIPGYLLFTKGYISFIKDSHFIVHFLMLYIGFDLAMYILHLASHYVWPFKNFHQKHHTHQYFNAISLYVMEPIESILFGLLLSLSAWVYPLNIYSFLSFIFFNWLFGVIGHLNTNSKKQPKLFGNHIFHKTHHQHPNNNYGFYTVIWDKLFGTFYKNQ